MPTTFASGLDDYPRALFPSDDEEHVDLLCWLMHAATTLSRIAGGARADAELRLLRLPNAAAFHSSQQEQQGECGEEGSGVGGGVCGAGEDTREALAAAAAFYGRERDRWSAVVGELKGSLDAVHWSDADGLFLDIGVTYPMPKKKPPKKKKRSSSSSSSSSSSPSKVATIGTDVVVSCGSASDPNDAVNVPVPYDYGPPPGSQRAEDVRQRRGCPKSHPTFKWPLGGSGPEGLMARGAVIAPALASTESPGNGQAAAQRRRVHHVGYNTLFPLLLTLLDPARDEVQLLALLKVLRDPKKLWSPHGLRSLSADDLFYGQENAPGDAPYWRGAIWMPINFLALRALKHYSADADAAGLGGGGSGGSAAVRENAAALYADLRRNLLRTVLGEWARTASVWEHYDDKTGRGMRSNPFTGWTALILNIMAEQYSL